MGKLEKENTCPHCDRLLDGFTSVDGDCTPSPGDITICVYCNSTLEFAKDLSYILATADSIAQVEFPVLQKAHRVVAEFNGDK